MTSVNVYRKKANQFANELTSNPDVTTILEDVREGWSSLSRKLKTVADMTPDGVYTESTKLGKNEEFMHPFSESLENYKVMYGMGDWCQTIMGTCWMLPEDPLTTRVDRTDVSFAEKLEIDEETKIIAIGDVHSGIHTFVEILDSLYERGILKEDMGIDIGYHLIFLGDLVDRGAHGLDVLHIIFRMKMRNMSQVHIINGNHEDLGTYSVYGFKDELESQLESIEDQNLVHELLTYLPSVIFVKHGKRWIQFCHGGIDPDYTPSYFLESEYEYEFHGYDEPLNLKYMGLRWNDFNGYVLDKDISESRGRGNTRILEYGPSATEEYLRDNNIEGIIRGHQDFMSVGILSKLESNMRDFDHMDVEGMLYPGDDHWSERIGNNEWEHLSIANAFKDYSVFTTSTAVKNKGVSHHTYLEIVSTTEEMKKYQGIVRSKIRVYTEFAKKENVHTEFLHLTHGELMSSKMDGCQMGIYQSFVINMKFRSNPGNFPLLVLDSMVQ